jgi:DNA/RNA endonuclease YhcR with UshA esterase domain
MKAFGTTMVALAGLVAAASPAAAHHAVQKVFDLNKPITVTGAITEVEWVNPHSYLSVAVKDAKGAAQHWTFELPGPAALRTAGLSSDNRTLKPGEVVTVDAIAAKDGTPNGFVYKLHTRDGRTFDLMNQDAHSR